ncbi:MAG: DUF7033 domain-containing protein [Janthinobacterium lividum]
MPATPAAPALPPVAPVTAAGRLAYVWAHFARVFPDAPAGTLGYAGSGAAVTVANQADEFFSQTQPYPDEPNWRDWLGQRIPFFFDEGAGALLTLTPGRAKISTDVISAAFYLLSGWQEYFSDARDQHGRFPYAASVQARHGFVALPVVNYYFDVLKTAIEHATGQVLRPHAWGPGAPFAAFVSHDVDSLRGGWGTAARHLLRRGQLFQLLRLAGRRVRRAPGPWDNLEHVQAETARYGAPSTFFILGDTRPAANGVRNADYNIDQPAFRQRLARLAAAGAEIASHGSYGTAEDFVDLQEEIIPFQPIEPRGNRFHYLCWNPTGTPNVLALAGVDYDSTLGFAEHFGFRNSYCHPFFPFNFQHGRAHDFLEIPLNVMDATLHHPSYLQLGPGEILPALAPMLAEVEKFGGVASVLWHNQNFDPANAANGPRQFHEIMGWLRSRGAAFLTGTEIWAQFPAA